MVQMSDVAPVLPTSDVAGSLEHYRLLGFEGRAYESGDGPPFYGYLQWDDVHLHLSLDHHHDPRTTGSQVYLYVSDADALHERWQAAGVPGRFVAPQDTDYGLREGAHVDPEGNLVRYGSRLAGHGVDDSA